MTDSDNTLYPWLEPAWKTLSRFIQSDRIPQGLLIHGPADIGKGELVAHFAKTLLCSGHKHNPCGECSACQLFAAGAHPDYQRIEPEEPGKAIKIDYIRELINDLSLMSQYRAYRVIVIDPADQMNLNSANALLKTLEEPADRTVIILLATRITRLPATILSRCTKIAIPRPATSQAADWLQMKLPDCNAASLLSAVGGSPLRAIECADTDIIERCEKHFAEFKGVQNKQLDPVRVAERWNGQSHEECVEWMVSWTFELTRLSLVKEHHVGLNPDMFLELRKMAEAMNPRKLLDFWRRLLELRQALEGQVNRQLLLEEALILWSRTSQPE